MSKKKSPSLLTKAQKDPSLRDIYNIVSGQDGKFKSIDDRFNDIDARFNDHDDRFDTLASHFSRSEKRFDKFEKRVEKDFAHVTQQLMGLHEGQVVIGQDVKALTHRVGSLEEKVEKMHGSLDDALIKIVNHNHRIGKLEKAHA